MNQLLFEDTYTKDPYFNIEHIEDEVPHKDLKHFSPHSHNYYVIIFIEKGEGKHFIDFNYYSIQPKSIFFISPNQVHQISETKSNKGFVISFNEEFLIKSDISNHFFQNINLFKSFDDTPPLKPSDKIFMKLKTYCTQMQDCFSQTSSFKHDALGSFVRLFLIDCNNICDLNKDITNQVMNSSIVTVRNFKNLVEQHYKTLHQAASYSEKLHISTNYLNKLVKNRLNSTTKDYILNRIILEVKRMLLNSNFTVKEISYELGFKEPAHLSNVFKNHTGLSIIEYRTQKN